MGTSRGYFFFVKIYRIYVKYKKRALLGLENGHHRMSRHIQSYVYYIYILQKQQNSKFHQYWGLVSCKPQISGVNSKSRLVMGGLQSWGGVRQGKMNAQQTNLSAPSPKTYTEQLTMMTMISHEFADHEFRMKYMFFFNKHMAMGQTRYPKTGWCTLR